MTPVCLTALRKTMKGEAYGGGSETRAKKKPGTGSARSSSINLKAIVKSIGAGHAVARLKVIQTMAAAKM